jgi:hypothetical protein
VLVLWLLGGVFLRIGLFLLLGMVLAAVAILWHISKQVGIECSLTPVLPAVGCIICM